MIRVLEGDCRAVLRTLPDASVHCVVTSPPYYGLRDYGTAQWDGGDAACQHFQASRRIGSATTLRTDGREHTGPYDGEKALVMPMPYRDTCGKCGARRIDSQIGLEQSPDDYIATMVGVFREVRRVLRDDGTCWVNLGDSFSGGNNVGWRPGNPDKNGGNSNRDGVGYVPGLAAKQLLMMPARLALALQADGWWLRSDIIWAKPNPMPESVTDRPTSAHEHVFLLTKSPRYFYDADAVREEAEYGRRDWSGGRSAWDNLGNQRANASHTGANPSAGRNLRNVWTIATEAFPEAHFATFPTALAERCIKAGTSERGCCAQCGAPWVRVTEQAFRPTQDPINHKAGDKGFALPGWDKPRGVNNVTTTGWSPGCQCNASTVSATVLDPFAGAGTTGLVADRLQRNAVLIELNPAYCAMMRERLTADAPLFMDLAAD